MVTDYEPTDVMDRESRSNRYYRNAVERHWAPGEIDLEEDRENLLAAARSGRFDIDPALVEETVTDLVPLVTGLTDIVEYGVGPKQLAGYAPKKHSQRMDQPSDASTDLAGVEELVRLEE